MELTDRPPNGCSYSWCLTFQRWQYPDCVVRAYDGENYSEVQSLRVKLENDSGDDDDSPGFGAALLLIIIPIAVVIRRFIVLHSLETIK